MGNDKNAPGKDGSKRDVLFLYALDVVTGRFPTERGYRTCTEAKDIELARGYEAAAKVLREVGAMNGGNGPDAVLDGVRGLDSYHLRMLVTKQTKDLPGYSGRVSAVIADLSDHGGVTKVYAQSGIIDLREVETVTVDGMDGRSHRYTDLDADLNK